IFGIFVLGSTWRVEPKPPAGKQVQIPRTLRTSFRAGEGPRSITTPLVCARFVSQHPGRGGLWSVFQVMIEQGLHDGAPEPGRGVALKNNFADAASFAAGLVVVPGTQHQMEHLALGVLLRQGLEQSRATVDVLLI